MDRLSTDCVLAIALGSVDFGVGNFAGPVCNVVGLTGVRVTITGLLFAGVIAIVGLFVIPYKRNQAKERYREKMRSLRNRLMGALSTQFNAEAENAIARMKDGVAPYTRFVRAERERVGEALNQLEALQRRIGSLKARVQAL